MLRVLPVRLFHALNVVLLLFLLSAAAMAQQGPSPQVREAIDSLIGFLGSEGQAPVKAFAETRLDPAWVQQLGTDKTEARLNALRDAARGIDGDVSVERAPKGMMIVLSEAGRRARIQLDLSPAGIRDLELVDAGKVAPAAAGRDAAVSAHVVALEQSGNADMETLLNDFEANRFSDALLEETTRDERRALLQKIRSVAAGAGAVMLEEDNDLIRLKMRGPESLAVAFKVEQVAPFRIDMLRTEDIDAGLPALALSWDEVAAHFESLEKDGFSGVVHLERDGKVLLHEAYGKSIRSLGYDNQINTVYGIGSTPIDFTVAGIYLLAQNGKLSLDDKVGKFFKNVPTEKKKMTIRHLISGRSGLPDFHDNESDWDADLAWVDRQTAIDRILAQPLLFAPGEGRAHSHSAYGLAAAIIEIVSGKGYFAFMSDAFFDPAGMNRTGMYGSRGGLELKDFAEGYGNSAVGIPNIPPNWGPTSWLVMGSGGMYSTLDDMLRFYNYVASSGVLKPEYADRYQGETVGVGGSNRGFYIFHAQKTLGNQAMMIINGEGRSPEIRDLSRALENLVMSNPE